MRWPLLSIVDGRYRGLAPRAPSELEAEGETVLFGELDRDGELLRVDERVYIDGDASLMLLDEEALDGRLVIAAGVLRRTASAAAPFDSYREAPAIDLLESACVMDVATWRYYSSSWPQRLGYFVVGRVMRALGSLQGGLPDPWRVLTALAIALLGTTIVAVTGSFIIATRDANQAAAKKARASLDARQLARAGATKRDKRLRVAPPGQDQRLRANRMPVKTIEDLGALFRSQRAAAAAADLRVVERSVAERNVLAPQTGPQQALGVDGTPRTASRQAKPEQP